MTSEESFARYEAIKAEVYPYHERDHQEWKAFRDDPEVRAEIGARYHTWREDRIRREQEAIRALIPRVGTPCTIHFHTDRRAATVVRIISQKKIAVSYNKVKCIEYYAGNYKILPELRDGEIIFTKRSNGKWIIDGHYCKNGVQLSLEYQDHYIDPHF